VKRPLGVTLLAVALAWVALGGLGLGLVSPVFAEVGVPWVLYRVAGLTYGTSALVAAVGLWKLTPWAHRAFQVWMASVLIAGSLPLLTGRAAAQAWGMLPVGWALLLAVLLPLAAYVRKSVQAAA